MKKFIFKIRLVLYSLLLLLVLGFFWLKIVPTGQIAYQTDFLKDDFFIRKISPTERVFGKNTIISNPVYFSLFTSRGFDQAKLIIEYQDSPVAELIEAGVMVGDKKWSYRTAPLQNYKLDNLAKQWSVINENGTYLWQRENKYSSVKDFFNNLPEPQRLAVYNYDLKSDYKIPDYLASLDKRVLNISLRGRHEIYTYIKNEKLNFNFTFQDLNENREADDFVINLYQKGQLVKKWSVPDDGNRMDNYHASENYNFSIEHSSLPEGVYKLEINSNDDILIKQIETTQTKLSFGGNLNLALSERKDISVFTDASYLSSKTTSPKALQSISVGAENLQISETYKQYLLPIKKPGTNEIKIPQAGISLSGNGIFAFSASEMINPDFKKVDQYLDLAQVDYILANYQTPKVQNNMKIAQVVLDLGGAYREKGQYSFMLSLPGYEAKNGEGVKIKNLKIELRGKSLWQKILEKIR